MIAPGGTRTVAITFGGYRLDISNGLANNTHAYTVEQQGGTTDTILLVVDSRAHAYAADDQSGVGSMSFVRSPACLYTANCALVVGRHKTANDGMTKVFWDEEVEVSDADGDGLGYILEYLLGTNLTVSDTDGDGLPDAAEVIGVDGGVPVKLPFMGANPLQKDVFFEQDWRACSTAGSTPDRTCGSTSDDPDFFKPNNAAYALAVWQYYQPNINVHIDNGIVNTDPSTWFKYGNWGGANRVSKAFYFCEGLTSSRIGLFHHDITNPAESSGQAADYNGHCFWAAGGLSDTGVFAQESGHGFGLNHGGPVSIPAQNVNCKPAYRSPMNYAYVYDASVIHFSHGLLPDITPSATNEGVGLGTTDPATLNSLLGNSYRFNASQINFSTGAIDLNRDGVITTRTTVEAAPQWGYAECNQSVHRRTQLTAEADPAMAWVLTGTGVTRFYLFGRSFSVPTRFDYVRAVTMTDCTGTRDLTPCVTWDIPTFTAVPSAFAAMNRAPSAVQWDAGAGWGRLMFVYANVFGNLQYMTMTLTDSGTESWSSPAFVGTGTEVMSGDPAVVEFGGVVYAFAPVGSSLFRWTWNGTSWTRPVTELWSDGTPVNPAYGIGVTTGYQVDLGSVEQLYAAIPRIDATANGYVEMARRDLGTGRWVIYPGAWPSGYVRTDARPGLAFRPNAGSSTVGRFYLAFNPWDEFPSAALSITMTEGNDGSTSATSRRIRWINSTFAWDSGQAVFGAVALGFDPRVDDRLRLAWRADSGADGNTTTASDLMVLAPVADGVLPVAVGDTDDYYWITQNLACSLTTPGSCP